jgi:hypothetical protein
MGRSCGMSCGEGCGMSGGSVSGWLVGVKFYPTTQIGS